MLRSFMSWLEEYLDSVGVAGLIEGALGVLAFGGLLGALLGDSAVKAAAIVVVLLAMLGVFLLVAGSRRKWRRRCLNERELLLRYCLLILHDRSSWRVRQWRQTTTIESNGDATVRSELRVVSERDGLPFFRLKSGPGWDQPSRYRDRVRFQVRSVELAGIGGTRYETSTCWKDGQLHVFVHFAEPFALGAEFTVVAELKWPGRCRPLMRDHAPDVFCMTAGPPLDQLEYSVVLPRGCTAFCDPVGFTRADPSVELLSRDTAEGRAEFSVRGQGLDDGRRVGMRLELK